MNTLNTRQSRQLIGFYSYFRIVIALVLVAIIILSTELGFSGFIGRHPLFLIISSTYISICIFQLIKSHSKKHDFSSLNLLMAILLDEAFILGLMYLGSTISTGLGILLITPISIAGIFFTGNSATIFAAIAALGILANHIYLLLFNGRNQDEVQVAMLGITFFIVSIGVQYLSRYIQATQQEALDSELKARLLTKLNQHIVQRIRTGVIIFDALDKIILTNQAADKLLTSHGNGELVKSEMIKFLNIWRTNGDNNHTLRHDNLASGMQVSFSALDEKGHIIAFIDDISEIAQQALQLKLASLGRLSASIAHEIRNPLNAISHSVQLLEESPDLTQKADLRLLNIARNHIKRIDEIIRNILGMSRQQQYQPERLELLQYSMSIKEEYQNNPEFPDIKFIIESSETSVIAPFDRSQLQQILTNLIDNGLRYSLQYSASYWIKLQLSYEEGKAVMNIYDKGQGVPEENQGKLFEPFFTSESTGTGLGLYLSRELCTLNQSQLSYIHNGGIEPHFQIRFAHADRDILVKTSNALSE